LHIAAPSAAEIVAEIGIGDITKIQAARLALTKALAAIPGSRALL